MIDYKKIVVSGLIATPPFEVERGNSKLEMFESYLKKSNYKIVFEGTDYISLAYIDENILFPNMGFRFDETGNLLGTTQNDTAMQCLPYWINNMNKVS